MPLAAWIATEFFAEFGSKLPITITPVDDGRLEVYLDGQTLFDRKAEGGKYPEMEKVRELKKAVRNKIAVAT
ncbi:MAG: Rdx family protein [Chloroflexi bacterium]|nr:Rdx family protein [Chloroflexota bacterium]